MKYLSATGKWPSGNVRYYLRKPGQKGIPMPDAPKESPRFLEAYAKAMGDTKTSPVVRHGKGTLGAAIRAHFASDYFLSLAPLTRQQRRRTLEDIEAKFGTAPVKGIQPRHIRKDLAKFSTNPANNRLKVWRALFSWLVSTGQIDIDPAQSVKARPAPKSDGHLPWTRDDLKKYRTHWGHDTPQRLCMELLYRSCAAMVDACALGPHMIKDGWLNYTRRKSGSLAVVPWTNAPDWFEWTDDLEKCLAAQPRHLRYIVTSTGKPRSEKAASQWFSKSATDAGLDPKKTAHGLRKLRAAMFRENGATEDQRKAILGHETSAEAEAYSKSADSRKVITGVNFPTRSQKVGKQP